MKPICPVLVPLLAVVLLAISPRLDVACADTVSVRVDAPMPSPRWAVLERKLLDDNATACREFFKKYFDDRGYLLCVVRWGANDGPNSDPQPTIIKSMMNGSRGPMLRKATALDWAGDPFDLTGFTPLHGERSYKEFLAHYEEYTDVVGDHFLNLVATTLPLNAYLATGDEKYRKWIVEYMDAWLGRMEKNGDVIPSKI